MDGVHDLGGMHGFGPVEPGADEPVFHAETTMRFREKPLALQAPWCHVAKPSSAC